MGKIFLIMGKSATGKDRKYRTLLSDGRLNLIPYTGYTTRPIRVNEENGREYYFVSEEELKRLEDAGKVVEKRVYHTVYGDWAYFTVAAEESEKRDLLAIGTPESYKKLRDYYGDERVVPIYLEVDDAERLERAIRREKKQEKPGYAEMCRRFLTDSEDFSEERLKEAGLREENRFDNNDGERCLAEIYSRIFKMQPPE